MTSQRLYGRSDLLRHPIENVLAIASLSVETTEPVIEHYRKLERFVEVDGGQPLASVTAEIVAAVERLRKRS